MPINAEEVNKVASLSKLELSNAESEVFTKKLQSVISMVELLEEIDGEGVEATFTVAHNRSVYREDVALQANMKEELLARVPETEDGYIKVPAIMDDGEAGA
ncbi:Asp-tRNA(Asn)/Glu-tRNA(Gln) amidotransferase subunit GatC [Vagococcus xieshaowenii]|uniref:Aspartyl/glutamyl-tRNA(Asn/Gln) amidotransferase subunit C n=1 Tax=Vagococcus xieshaowenii TaxID=2562451 RepID=A0A4Z0DC91_9ENTE|nr:Asp-tRNA(Asn)/Glu-tRNA(Gln) amidotransferase subunit GatC [Vagococcus xieshaowenii]QCA28191.1 Asp-tRNA(Asn)/Glu-tRNA(Gln) amidotransferase subunit GatC [Vagococcus xieshaowenii]TFZ42544.1 Asp-tRNA(Asn)/Glu-tRNA(Gln) amidotransferase subunit GatC [Vagococcus xieshaowenii]